MDIWTYGIPIDQQLAIVENLVTVVYTCINAFYFSGIVMNTFKRFVGDF